jgi:menaquinone-dependent protoporphyrinogen oxidase
MPAAEQLVQNNLSVLAVRPVWLFSVGTFGDSKPIIGPLMKREPRGMRTFERAIHPMGCRVFAGVIDRRRWPFASRLFYHALGGRLGDNRDWREIDAWADRIGHALDGHAQGPVAGTVESLASHPVGMSVTDEPASAQAGGK